MHNYDRDLSFNQPKFGPPTKRQKVTYWGGLGVAAGDNASAYPAFLAGYRRAINEGMSHEDAVSAGDKTVKLAHSSAGKMDLSALQAQDNEIVKLSTMAYSFFNHTFNQLADTAKTGKRV